MSDPNDNFLDQYLQYTSNDETPKFFHRWSCISGIGAILGRQYYIHHVDNFLFPNMYVMLIGSPGTRKNTAVNAMRKVVMDSGYLTIAADKTSKEKFLLDLSGMDTDESGSKYGSASNSSNKKLMEEMLSENLWGESDESVSSKPPAEVYIIAPEFNDFLGSGNMEFISLLGNLWDYNGIYKSRIKTGKSIAINDPTISIIGGNTATGFSLAFPPEIFGQGFFSRLLLVYGEPTGRKIAFPKRRSEDDKRCIVEGVKRIKSVATGEAKLTRNAELLAEKIYNQWKGIDDVRFASYANRRFTHLLKLSLVISAIHFQREITDRHVVVANTLLTHTENLMPKALGEFGKAKNSDVAHKVMQVIEASEMPMSLMDIWPHVAKDLDKLGLLGDMINSLAAAGRIVHMKGIGGKSGFMVRKRVLDFTSSDMLDWSILTQEEKDLL